MPRNQTECLQLIQDAVNALNALRVWEDWAHMRAQRLGLQGEKRRERDDEHEDLCLMQYLQSVAVDLFDAEVYPAAASTSFPQIGRIPDYFKTYLAQLWEAYDELHTVANDLVIKGYKSIAEPIYCHIGHLFDEIIETRRTIKEGDLAGWEYHHVSRYQVAMDNVHDRYEGKEKKHGYTY